MVYQTSNGRVTQLYRVSLSIDVEECFFIIKGCLIIQGNCSLGYLISDFDLKRLLLILNVKI